MLLTIQCGLHMQVNDLNIDSNSQQNSKNHKRKIIKLSDFEGISSSDINNMFGNWKEADHCDKDIHS